MPIYTIALELTILLAFWLWLSAWQRERNTPGRNTFAALTVATIIWCLGAILEQQDQFPEVIADRIRYLGILSLPPLWLGLAAHATRLDLARRVPWFPLVLLAPLCIPYGLMFAGSWSVLFVRTVEGGTDQYGPVWWLTVTYSYALMATGCGLFLVEALRWRRPGQWIRRLCVGMAPMIPLTGNSIYIARGMIDPFDPTPLLFGVVLVALRNALYPGSLLQALPISQHDLIEQLPVGLILTDRSGVVIDLNPAAQKRLAVTESCAIGRNYDAVVSEADPDLRPDVTPIFSHGREVGQLVLLDPPDKDARA
jgi:PAS domain-containing protein